MTLDKKLVDEVIRLTRKYYRTKDSDYLPKLIEAEKVLVKKVRWETATLLYDMAKYTQLSGRGTYDDIYKALAVFGIIVEEISKIKELEKWQLERIKPIAKT